MSQLSDGKQKFFAGKGNYCAVCPQMTANTIPGFPVFTQTFLFGEADTWSKTCYFLFLIHILALHAFKCSIFSRTLPPYELV